MLSPGPVCSTAHNNKNSSKKIKQEKLKQKHTRKNKSKINQDKRPPQYCQKDTSPQCNSIKNVHYKNINHAKKI